MISNPGEASANLSQVISAVLEGRPVVMVDSSFSKASNVGKIVLSAQLASASSMAFVVRHTSGFICAPLTHDIAERLDLPPMVRGSGDRKSRGFTVSVDARDGISTGISARDRARTVQLLADPSTRDQDLCRPGHVIPVRTANAGVLGVQDFAEASVDLMRLAGLHTVAAIADIVSRSDPCCMAFAEESVEFAKSKELEMVTILEIARARSAVIGEPI